MEDIGKIYDHMVLFTSIWYISWQFGKFYCYLVYFSHFGMLYKEESGNREPT
jgi:hypothetical protein